MRRMLNTRGAAGSVPHQTVGFKCQGINQTQSLVFAVDDSGVVQMTSARDGDIHLNVCLLRYGPDSFVRQSGAPGSIRIHSASVCALPHRRIAGAGAVCDAMEGLREGQCPSPGPG